MKIFMDTANVAEIAEMAALGVVYGVTTNPSLIAKSGRTQAEVIPEICSLVDGPVSAEVISTDCEGMVAEARKLMKISDKVVVKIPCIAEGLKAVKILAKESGVQPAAGTYGSACRCNLCKPVYRPFGRHWRKRCSAGRKHG